MEKANRIILRLDNQNLISKTLAGTGVRLKGKILDETNLRTLSNNVFNLATGGTSSFRKSIDRLKSSIMSFNKELINKNAEDIFAHAQSLINKSTKEGSEKAIQLLNTQIFVALDPASGITGYTASKNIKSLTNTVYNLFGKADDSPLVRMSKVLKKRNFPIDITETVDTEEDNNYLIVKYEKLNDADNKEEIKEIITSYINSLDDSAEKIYNTTIPIKELNDLIVNNKSVNKIGKSTNVRFLFKYESEDGIGKQYDFYNVKLILIFTIENGAIKISSEIAEQYVPESSQKRFIENNEVIDSEDKKQLLKIKIDKFNIQNKDSADNLIEYNKLLKIERSLTGKSSSVFDYGHVISAATVKIANIYNAVSNFKFEGMEKSPSYAAFKNMVNTLGIILEVSDTVDSVLENIYSPDVEGLTRKDLLNIIESLSKDDTTVENLHIYTKRNGLVDRGTKVSRTIEIGIDDKKQTKEIVALMERKRFNARVKGFISQYLLREIRKQAREGFIKEFTTESFIQKMIQDISGSDTLIGAATKQVFNIKIDKGTSKVENVKIKLKKNNVVLNKISSKPMPKKSSTPIYRATKKKKSAPSSSKKIVKSNKVNPTVSKAASDRNSLDIVGIVNSQVQEVLLGNMTHPALRNRSGRFRDSVKALSLNNNELSYTYMRNPYEVFSSANGKSPWNTPPRDPEQLIERSINTILRKYKKKKINLKGV